MSGQSEIAWFLNQQWYKRLFDERAVCVCVCACVRVQIHMIIIIISGGSIYNVDDSEKENVSKRAHIIGTH